jgi:hypothetical protein
LDQNQTVGSVADKSDVYVKRNPMKKIKCGHKGCDKEYMESENNDTACNVNLFKIPFLFSLLFLILFC